MAQKVAYATDLHGNRKLYDLLLHCALANSCEAVIMGGDIAPTGAHEWGLGEAVLGIRQQREFLQDYLLPTLREFRREAQIDLYIMMGNDDRRINLPLLEAEEGRTIKLLHNKVYDLAQFSIVGYPFIPPSPFLLKDWERYEDGTKLAPLWQDPCLEISKAGVRTVKVNDERTIADDLQELKRLSDPASTIYLFHAPPYGTDLDLIGVSGRRYQGLSLDPHAGSTSIRRFIQSEQPPLTLHGHIHASYRLSGHQGITIGRTVCLNPGSQYERNILNLVIINLEDLSEIEFFRLTP